MIENSKTMIDDLCKKLRCSKMAEDFERVNHARGLLTQLQQNEILNRFHLNSRTKSMFETTALKVSDMLLVNKQRLDADPLRSISSEAIERDKSFLSMEEFEEESGTEHEFECDNLSSDRWLGFFRGYDILKENPILTLSGNKQCILMSLEDDCCSLEDYIRNGVRCFMIDLFLGTDLEKQKLIFHLREAELKISKQYGIPVNATLSALLSPRLQYTGVLKSGFAIEKLEKGNHITLTTKRKYTVSSSCSKIYVNAHFLLEDCKEGDFILVGPSIQLTVIDVLADELKCTVVEPGLLSSRMPVRFPARCSRSQVSLEELEDITFAREVGIKVLVSHTAGSPQFFKELQFTLDLLKYDNVKLFTRLVLNHYEHEDIGDIELIANSYEGFLVEIDFHKVNNCCQTEDISSFQAARTLELSPTCAKLMEQLFNQTKPIIFNPILIAQRQLYVSPQCFPYIFQFPDKFLFNKDSLTSALNFFLLQNAVTGNMDKVELPFETLCKTSATGVDQLARACVAASFQSQINAIVVCSRWSDTAIKISHFRPEVPVMLASPTKSFNDFLSLYHHVIFMHFQAQRDCNYIEYVASAFKFCLIYLNSQKIVCDGQSVLLVYATNSSTQFCDKYVIYKLNENHFPLSLEGILFP